MEDGASSCWGTVMPVLCFLVVPLSKFVGNGLTRERERERERERKRAEFGMCVGKAGT